MGDESNVRVRVLQLGRRVMAYEGPAGATVAGALESVGVVPGAGMDIRVNGVPAEPTRELHDGETVTIIPRIKGGSTLGKKGAPVAKGILKAYSIM